MPATVADLHNLQPYAARHSASAEVRAARDQLHIKNLSSRLFDESSTLLVMPPLRRAAQQIQRVLAVGIYEAAASSYVSVDAGRGVEGRLPAATAPQLAIHIRQFTLLADAAAQPVTQLRAQLGAQLATVYHHLLAEARRRSLERFLETMHAIQPVLDEVTAPYADYFVIESTWASNEEQVAAIERQAAVLEKQWRVRDARVLTALVRRAHLEGRSVRAVKLSELMAAIPMVVRHDMVQLQLVKLGVEWLCDASGHKLPIRPDALPLRYAYAWADRRIIAVAEASVLDMSLEEYRADRKRRAEAGKRTRKERHESDQMPLEPLSLESPEGTAIRDRLAADADADPLYVLMEREETQQELATQEELWERMWTRATPAQTSLLRALLKQLRRGGSVGEAAAELGISKNTAYAQLRRLRAALNEQDAM